MARLFGTDGARGVANRELTCELALQIGRAAATVLTRHLERQATLVIGKDPRLSSDMLESALTAGICSVGADVVLLGTIPTPAVAHLVARYRADAGVMISASHNPAEYNGIKLFDGRGYKLPDALEDEIEAVIQEQSWTLASSLTLGRVTHRAEAADDYVQFLCSTVDNDLLGMKIAGRPSPLKIAVDCANGSASYTAPKLFATLGVDCACIHCEPDGRNINDRCGSTHTDDLSRYVVEHGCDLGFAFDGDADRCLAVDENGRLVDGDRIIALLARDLQRQGRLSGDTVVVTVMSNLGFFRFCEQNALRTAVTKVGDRYVLEEMLKNGYCLGGEQSGHIIFTDYMTTGDGQLSAIQLLQLFRKDCRRTLGELAADMELYPQVLVNVQADAVGKERFGSDPVIADAIRRCESALGADGRILVRVSGTEPYIRVMMEGRDPEQISRLADTVAECIRKQIGG